MARAKEIRMDLALRASGVLLLCAAAFFAHRLFGAGARHAGLPDYLYAVLGFLCGSSGSAMVWQGHHLFDQVELSSRWTSHLS